jgi:FMN reductase
MSDRTITVISAGLGQPSSTRMLADRLAAATVSELAERGLTATVETFELRDVAHEIINHMLTGFPSGDLRRVLESVGSADGLIAVTPLFTTTYSGLFKSFVDILDKDSLTRMPVLLGATGGTPRHSLALEYSMRPLFTYLRADVANTSVFAATDDWSGELDNQDPLPSRITRGARELAELVAARPNTGPADPYADAPSFTDLLGSL